MLQDLLITHARATASTILGSVKSLVLQLEGLLGDTADNEPMYSALGVVARPKAPVTAATGVFLKGECEVLAVKNEDGMAPFAYRDLRLHERCPSPAEGDIFVAGYQGGYLSIRAATSDLGDVVKLYAPRIDSSGTFVLAHSLTLDPHSSSSPAIALEHGGGFGIRITNAGATEVRNKLVVAPDSAQQQVALFTDLNTWIGQVNAYLVALKDGVIAAGGTVVGTPPAATPIGTPKLTAAP